MASGKAESWVRVAALAAAGGTTLGRRSDFGIGLKSENNSLIGFFFAGFGVFTGGDFTSTNWVGSFQGLPSRVSDGLRLRRLGFRRLDGFGSMTGAVGSIGSTTGSGMTTVSAMI